MKEYLVVEKTDIPELKLFKRGKVRDIYGYNNNLLIIATDRISAFDFVLPTPIPLKGAVLTQLSVFWFQFFKDILKTHYITDTFSDPIFDKYRDVLAKRAMLVKKVAPLPVECIVRGYLFGSAWKEYRETGKVSDLKLPSNMKEAEKLPEPIFTPSTKSESGHDENISFEKMTEIIGNDLALKVKEKSLQIYQKAQQYAEERGIIIADTKFEFGLSEGEIILIDEILTPDSSRFWPKEEYQPGQSPKSFDKQYVRDYLEKIGWDKSSAPPSLPKDVVQKTTEKYLEAYRLLTGKEEL